MENSNNIQTSYDSQQLHAIFETVIDCIIILNEKGIITKINPAGSKLFGYQINELIGQNVKLLMPSPYKEKHDEYMQNYHHTGEAKIIGKGRDVEGQKKNGTTFPCQLSVNEFSINGVRYYAGIIHDLTHRKKVEQQIIDLNNKLESKIKLSANDLSAVVNELLESNKRLEKEIAERKKVENVLRENEREIRVALEKEKELNDLKSRFVSMASHEFRTPLSTIQSSTDLIKKYVEAGKVEKTTKHFGKIDSSIKNLTDILSDFLSISKLEEGKLAIVPEQFSLHDFISDFKEKIKDLLKENQVLDIQLPEEKIEITLDKKAVHHVLLNLFSNAIKYSKEGQTIFLLVEVFGEQLIMRIKDQGIGIPHNEQRYLFERFFRGSNAINIKGTGLGLNIVKQYVDMMNGSIYFESQEGNGTTFTIVLPLIQ